MRGEFAVAGAVYTWYAELMRRSPEGLGGSLLLALFTRKGAQELVRAANIAGAATLFIGPDTEAGRAQVRSGVCDFMVTTLEEALRVLKNEIRRRRQVAVFLLGDPDATVQACVERGVQPELLGCSEQALVGRGAQVVTASDSVSFENALWWTTAGVDARTLGILEALALEAMDAEGRPARRRWVAQSPQYLGRELAHIRTVPLSEEEAERFCAAARDALLSDRLSAGTSVWRRGVELVAGRAG